MVYTHPYRPPPLPAVYVVDDEQIADTDCENGTED